MRIVLDSLPTDTAMLQQLVRDMAAALASRDAAVAGSQVEIDRLRLIIRQFQRARFGRSAERPDPDQMAFGLEELEADLERGRYRGSPDGRAAAPGAAASPSAADRDRDPGTARELPGLWWHPA